MTRKWTRWQDWVAVVVGVIALLTPLWYDPNTTGGTTAFIVLGVLLILAALWSLAMPGAIASEWVHAALGGLLFISPWVFSYQDEAGAAWSSWILGAIAIIVGLWAVPASQQAHNRLAHQ